MILPAGTSRSLDGLQRFLAGRVYQHIMTREAIDVDSFERPAATTPAVAARALRSSAVAVPCFALPLGGGRYRIVYDHPVEPPAADCAAPIREFTQRCTDVLEMYLGRHPELWLWMHRRWREADPSADGAPATFPATARDDERAEES